MKKQVFIGSCKILFISLLFFVFIFWFGFPSLEKYLKKGVIVQISKDSSSDGKVQAPAATLCALNQTTGKGWKMSNNVTDYDSMYNICKESDGVNLTACINASTYSLDEILPGFKDITVNNDFVVHALSISFQLVDGLL